MTTDDPAALLPPSALERLLRELPTDLLIWELLDPADPTSFRMRFASPSLTDHQGNAASAHVGRPILEYAPYLPLERLDNLAQVLRSGKSLIQPEHPIKLPDGSEHIVRTSLIPLSPTLLASLIEDVTDRIRAEAAQRQLVEQQDIIRRQQESLMELSTPLIPITDTVVAMPLVGALDSRRAQQVITTLLEGIADTRAAVAILDITGVPIVDTQVANALIQAAQAVKLLGSQVVLTGIRPEVAQTLTGLGVQLSDIITMSTLQAGISYATQA
ncbi:MAG TPA: STAS domain-containing protein [Herpetosiphonaceae bacterium]|nr:STAS domain-containing protein [Herpetosiphonaceae bacterium]